MACYLVTGGCGFIGSNLVKYLCQQGHEIVVLDDLSLGDKESLPEGVRFIEADICDLDKVAKSIPKNVGGCFHLAANPSIPYAFENYLDSHRVNLGGTLAVFEWASKINQTRQKRIKVVYASSCAVYGGVRDIPLREDGKTQPLNSYGADKECGEIHARMAAIAYGVPSIGLRLFNVFGPGQRTGSTYSGVLSIFCEKVLSGQQVTIFGDGTQIRDFVFVDDVVLALVSAMSKVDPFSSGVFNICSGSGTSIMDAGKMISEICGAQFLPNYTAERESDIKVSLGDPKRAKRFLGWESKIDIKVGLKQTAEAQRKQGKP